MTTAWPPPFPAPVAPQSTSVQASVSLSKRSPFRQNVDRWVGRSLVVAIIAASVVMDTGALFVVPVLFVMIVPFEKMFPRHRGQRIRRPGFGTDMAHALAASALAVVGGFAALFVGVVSLAWIPGLVLRPLVTLIPTAAMPFVGVALFDFAFYWVHRWSHEVPFFWRFHSVHHSPVHMDWISGFRNHPFDGALLAPPFVLLIAAGFDAAFTGVLAVIQIVTGLFLHANVRWRLKVLHRVVITPEFHHWHHANETDAHNSNYSIFLPLWDITFGTYFMPKGRRPQRYGISEPMPSTLIGQLKHPLRGAGSPWRFVRHPWRNIGRAGKFVRSLVGEIHRSTTRPVRS